MQLNELKPAAGSTKNVKRLGRGPGSGLGKTSGKGHKGQNCRSGAKSMKGFEGGQMPLHRRLPKVGFTNIFKKKYALLNLADLERFKGGDVIDEVVLRDAGLVKGNFDGIKLLGEGEIKTSLTLKVDKASKSAVSKVEAAGGKVETV
ncbi:MAG: 50S ribosomal protein L15 [Proteobacteria bacterium]|nr:50S ribosomal protein L15 [Pseudomonadota bacterium]